MPEPVGGCLLLEMLFSRSFTLLVNYWSDALQNSQVCHRFLSHKKSYRDMYTVLVCNLSEVMNRPFYSCQLRPRAVLKTEGTVFPNKDRPRPANNVFIFFFRGVLCKQLLCWIFTAAFFKPGVRVRWHLGNRKSNQHYTHSRKLRNDFIYYFIRSYFPAFVLQWSLGLLTFLRLH